MFAVPKPGLAAANSRQRPALFPEIPIRPLKTKPARHVRTDCYCTLLRCHIRSVNHNLSRIEQPFLREYYKQCAHDVWSFRAHPPRPDATCPRRITHAIMRLHTFVVGQHLMVDQAAASCIVALGW